jgi:hypothetical protein
MFSEVFSNVLPVSNVNSHVNVANANVASIGKYFRKCKYFCKCEYSLFILVMTIPRGQVWCNLESLVSFRHFGKGKLDHFIYIKYVLYIKMTYLVKFAFVHINASMYI